MLMEAVRGAETYTFASTPDYGELAAAQNACCRSPRNVIGLDGLHAGGVLGQMIRRRTTRAHETALAVLFESGTQHIGEGVETLRTLPEDYLTFFRNLENVRDETLVRHDRLPEPGHGPGPSGRGRPARWARRSLNGEDEGKTL